MWPWNVLSIARIVQLLERITMTQQELETKLAAANTQMGKVRTEIQALKDAIASAGNVPASVEAAANQLFATIQLADDDNPDATP